MSIRAKGLLLVSLGPAVFAGALASGWAWTGVSTRTLLAQGGAFLLALIAWLVTWRMFRSGIEVRLGQLRKIFEGRPREVASAQMPLGSDDIGAIASLMSAGARRLISRSEQRDRARRELDDLLNASPVVLLRFDVRSQSFSYASPNVEDLLGLTPEQVVSDQAAVVERFHPDDRNFVRDAILSEAARRGEKLKATLRCRTDPASDQWREADVVYSVAVDENDRISGIVAHLMDTSERHAALQAADERRFLLESIFRAVPDTIVVRDTESNVVIASPDSADVMAGESRLQLRPLLDACLAGDRQPEPITTLGKTHDGALRTFETRARPVFDRFGAVTGTVTVSRDVTDRVTLEESLRSTSTEAKRASEAKSEFLSRMSHELRTPLNAILGFAQLLELDELPGEQASSVEQIKRAGRHLLSLINEVLDISRIEAGRLSLSTEPVRIGDVLGEVAGLLSPVADAAEVHLVVDAGGMRDEFVQGDRQRLLQVLLNLGSNAVKYTGRGGSVALRTSPTSAGNIRFAVHDSGPGIPHDQQDQLFVPFSRLGAERSSVEGTGVGLALSKQLVELMDGQIGVESAPGRGSVFWVDITRSDAPVALADSPRASSLHVRAVTSAGEPTVDPAAGGLTAPGDVSGATAASASKAEAALRGERSEMVVLHIEDNASNATLVEQILARRPFVRLISATEGRLGLELAREYRPELILLDLHLPDLSGDELLYRIQAMPELAGTKVVVVSADATPSRIRRMLDLGVEGYLTKPVDVDALLGLVDRSVQGSLA